MATENDTACEPRGPHWIDAEGAVRDVTGLVALGMWIENARQIADSVASARRIYPDLDAVMREHNLRTWLEWEEEESFGLYLLLRHIREAVAGLEPERADAAASM